EGRIGVLHHPQARPRAGGGRDHGGRIDGGGRLVEGRRLGESRRRRGQKRGGQDGGRGGRGDAAPQAARHGSADHVRLRDGGGRRRPQASSSRKIASIGMANRRAILKASGREGS